MDKLIINGKKQLFGEIEVKSAKNAILPLIACCILLDFEVAFLNCPKLSDVDVMLEIIKKLGGAYRYEGDTLYVDCSKLYIPELPCEYAQKIRASVFMLGPLLARFHKASTSEPGGCNFEKRPIDMHLDCFEKIGAEVSRGDYVFLKTQKLTGGVVMLPFKSVGVTLNLIMASCVGDSETVIVNAAKEPEIVCLANFINKLGGCVIGAGTSKIYVKGVKKLSKNISRFKPITDRIETGTYILAVLTTGGEIEIKGANFSHNICLIKKIFNNTCKMTFDSDKIYIKSSGKGRALNYVKTQPYPFFPTDLQSPLLAYSCFLNGKTVIEEGVFTNRFSVVSELKKMNANVEKSGNRVTVIGSDDICGAEVTATDLRGGASLVIAGLGANGTTVINGLSNVERGYYEIDKKLTALGADIRKG